MNKYLKYLGTGRKLCDFLSNFQLSNNQCAIIYDKMKEGIGLPFLFFSAFFSYIFCAAAACLLRLSAQLICCKRRTQIRRATRKQLQFSFSLFFSFARQLLQLITHKFTSGDKMLCSAVRRRARRGRHWGRGDSLPRSF